MGLAARREYEEKYSVERNAEALMGIYGRAAAGFEARRAARMAGESCAAGDRTCRTGKKRS